MKGRSLEEIDEMFEKRVPIRKFATYECECTKQAHDLVVEKAKIAHTEDIEKEAMENPKSGVSS